MHWKIGGWDDWEITRRRAIAVCLSVVFTPACGDTTIPKPADPRPSGTDQIKTGAGAKRLKGSFMAGRRYETFRVVNMDVFEWTIPDYIELSATFPVGSLPPGRLTMSNHYVTLRCPGAWNIPAGGVIEIPFDACAQTTQKPEPGAHGVEPDQFGVVSAIRVVAREGYLETGIEPALEFGRPLSK